MVGGIDEDGKRSDQMHFLNLEMGIAINLPDRLPQPMAPCFMLKDQNKIYILGGLGDYNEDSFSTHIDMMYQIKVEMQGEMQCEKLESSRMLTQLLARNHIPLSLEGYFVV